jgi:hypothetical protein
MQFLFVRLGLCLRLPSDPTSQWTILQLANDWCYQPPKRTFTTKLPPLLVAQIMAAFEKSKAAITQNNLFDN